MLEKTPIIRLRERLLTRRIDRGSPLRGTFLCLTSVLTLSFILGCWGCSTPPPLKPEAELPKACWDFARSPDTFRKIELRKEGRADAFDFDPVPPSNPQTEHPERVQHYLIDQLGESCPTSVLCRKEGDGKCRHRDYLNAKEHFGEGASVEIYSKGERLYWSSTTPKSYPALSEITPTGLNVLCGFRKQLVGWEAPAEHEPVCEQLADGQETKLDASSYAEKTTQDWGETRDRFVPVDLRNDGTSIKVVAEDVNSRAGCGCKMDLIVLKDEEGHRVQFGGQDDTPPKEREVAEALARLTSKEGECDPDREWSLVQIGAKNYVLSGPSEPNLANWPASRIFYPKELYEWREGKFERICSQEPKTETVPVSTSLL